MIVTNIVANSVTNRTIATALVALHFFPFISSNCLLSVNNKYLPSKTLCGLKTFLLSMELT